MAPFTRVERGDHRRCWRPRGRSGPVEGARTGQFKNKFLSQVRGDRVTSGGQPEVYCLKAALAQGRAGEWRGAWGRLSSAAGAGPSPGSSGEGVWLPMGSLRSGLEMTRDCLGHG